jgi:hypothetical protein
VTPAFAQGFRVTGSRRWALLVEALALHAIVKLGIRLMAWQRLRALLERAPRFLAGQPEPVDIARAVRASTRPIGGATCLADALVAYTMLNRRRHAARLHIGVRHGEARVLEAHAWVECDGAVVIGDVPELARYARLA